MTISAPVRPDAVGLAMPRVACDAWWSPADSAYVAVNLDFPPFVHSDPQSAQAAIDGLEAAIRKEFREGAGHSAVGSVVGRRRS